MYSESNTSYNKSLNYVLDKNEFSHLYRKTIDIEVYKPRFLIGAKFKGKFSIKLNEFKSKCTIQNKFKMQIQSKRFEPEYDITLKIREPIVDKEYKETQKQVFNITKTYLPFDIKTDYSQTSRDNITINKDASQLNPVNNTNNTNNPSNNIVKKQPLSNNVSSKDYDKKNISAKKNEEAEINLSGNNNKQIQDKKIDPSEFNQIELTDPDSVECLNSLVVLENKLKLIELELKKVEGRPPMNLRQNKMKVSCKIKMLKDSIEGGTLSLENYVNMIAAQYQRELKLIMYFKQINDLNKVKIIEDRQPLLKKEVEEGLAMIKK